MREFKLYIPAFISIILCTILALIFGNEMEKKKANDINNSEIYHLEFDIEEVCDSITPYTDIISTYCIKEIYYVKNDNKKSLRSAFGEEVTIDEILEKMELKHGNNYLFYTSKDNLGNVKFKIIKCNDKYIIGNNKLEYKEEYCE